MCGALVFLFIYVFCAHLHAFVSVHFCILLYCVSRMPIGIFDTMVLQTLIVADSILYHVPF